MNLGTISEVLRPRTLDQIDGWRDGYAWLAGGTWLFSEPQVDRDTLIDLDGLCWPALTVTEAGLEIAATCRIAELDDLTGPQEWSALPLKGDCARSLLASFKIWNAATVGGNICMSLPAGAMISLTTALEGVYTLWPREGEPREVAAVDFVTGDHANVLAPGELLRSITIPNAALAKRYVFRQQSLVKHGRSAALIIGTCGQDGSDFRLTVTAATPRPIQFVYDTVPTHAELRGDITRRLSEEDYFHDVNGSARYKQHLTYYFSEQIRMELS
ncbi:FAD binding domain-containing protein [Rhodococcoides yunnanense]|uniref:FAD binding domain-containing protein n=1 Tax=Rhodococcoides yunnanense TaxID=278209 RepID=UPI0009353C56|nr:FAD binding domain-containing protein [Rhodococcus yunnanensis]